MGNLFGTRQKQTTQQQSTQSGTTQSNIFDDPRFQGAMGSFFEQFSPGNISTVNTGPTAPQLQAAGALGANLVPAAGIAAAGLTPGMISSMMSPYISSVVNPTMAAMDLQNRQNLSNLRGRMAGRGALGNNVGSEAAYLAGVAPGQAAAIGNIYNQGYQQAADTGLKSLGAQLGATGQVTQGATALGNVGEQIRLASLQNQMTPFQLTSQLSTSLAPFLQAAGLTTTGTASGTGSSNTATTPGIGNVIAGLVGTALQFMPSDPDLKENMREIGRTHDGQPLYAYNFRPGLGLPRHTQIGLNADEVVEHDPGAVAETPAGRMVNYDRALAPAERRDGGDVMNKVARAFSMIRGMKREAMADGGAADNRPGYFLGGLTDGLTSAWQSIFPSTTNLGTGPGGWETTVSVGGEHQPAARRVGRGLGSFSDSLGGLGGRSGQPDNSLGAALGQQQTALAALLAGLGSAGNTGRRAAGGRVSVMGGHEERAPGSWVAPLTHGRIVEVDPEGFHGRSLSLEELYERRAMMDEQEEAGDYDEQDRLERALQWGPNGPPRLPPGPLGGMTPNDRLGYAEGGATDDYYVPFDQPGPMERDAPPRTRDLGTPLIDRALAARTFPGLTPPTEPPPVPVTPPNSPADPGGMLTRQPPINPPGPEMWTTSDPPPALPPPPVAPPPPADPWTATVNREAPEPPTTWWGRLQETLFPRRGHLYGEPPTPLQNAGLMLMQMGGDLVGTNRAAQGILAGQEQNLKRTELERQTAALQHRLEHDRRTLEEATRHHRQQEMPPAVRLALEILGPAARGTPEFAALVRRLAQQDRAESAFDVSSAQAAVRLAGELGTRTDASNENIERLNQLETLLGAPGVPSGALADWQLTGRRLATALFPGINTEGIGEAEAANALSNQMALAARSTANGAGMPGAMSDADRTFLSAMQPGITRTPDGNRLMIGLMRDTERYRVAANTEALRYIREHRSEAGLREHMRRWMDTNTMEVVVPGHAALRERFRVSRGGTVAPPPPGQPPPESTPPPPEAVRMLRAARGTPDEARRIHQFNETFGAGSAERFLADSSNQNPPTRYFDNPLPRG